MPRHDRDYDRRRGKVRRQEARRITRDFNRVAPRRFATPLWQRSTTRRKKYITKLLNRGDVNASIWRPRPCYRRTLWNRRRHGSSARRNVVVPLGETYVPRPCERLPRSSRVDAIHVRSCFRSSSVPPSIITSPTCHKKRRLPRDRFSFVSFIPCCRLFASIFTCALP